MDMDQSAVFLAGSILTMLGFIVIAAGLVVINNILSKYWKPVRMFTQDSWHINPPERFASHDELSRVAPEINNGKEKTK
jgi:hypothetical protein